MRPANGFAFVVGGPISAVTGADPVAVIIAVAHTLFGGAKLGGMKRTPVDIEEKLTRLVEHWSPKSSPGSLISTSRSCCRASSSGTAT